MFVDVSKYRKVVSALEGTTRMIFSGTSTCWRNELMAEPMKLSRGKHEVVPF